jgi:mRNA interferase RelE/StbE
MYSVSFSTHAYRDLEKIQDPHYTRLKNAIYKLAQNPRPAGCKKLIGSKAYRIRVGDYRIVYAIEDGQLIVIVVAVDNRKDVYRN